MELSDDELYNIMLEILAGKRYVTLPAWKNQTACFVAPKYPLKKRALLLEESRVKFYSDGGLLRESEISEEDISDYFTTYDKDELEEVESKITAYEALLRKRVKGSLQYESDLKKLEELRDSRKALISRRNDYKQFTADYRAREDKYLFLLVNCTYDLEERRFWLSTDEFLSSCESDYQSYSILNSFLNFYFGYDSKMLRKIARNEVCKNYYINAVKGLTSLFGDIPAPDLSIDQVNLLSWWGLYTDLNELPVKDRPSREVIEDDERLDKFLEEYTRKTRAEQDVERNRSKTKSKALDQQHVVVTAESENYVSFHKKGLYSDTELITRRSEEGSTSYNEKEELARVKKKLSKVNRK